MGALPFESLVAQGRRRGPPRCLKVSRDNAEYSPSEALARKAAPLAHLAQLCAGLTEAG